MPFMKLNIKDSFNSELPSDSNRQNSRRQVYESTHSYVTPRVPSHPKLIHASKEMAEAIGLDEADIKSTEFLEVFSGAKVYPKTKPFAKSHKRDGG